MGSVIAQSRSRRGPTALYAVAGVIVAAVVLAAVLGMQRPVEVKVDGKALSVSPRTTVAKLVEQHLFTAPRGNLLSVKGKVLRKGGGAAPVYLRNGQAVSATQLVYAGDEFTSRAGADATEQVVVKKSKVAPSTQEEGRGPIAETVRKGIDGEREVRVGAVSGIVVSSSVVRKAVPELVRYRSPSSTDKVVALTFDDGPWPHTTDQILDILKKERIKATFFMLGARARVQPETARRVVAEGHDIGNHSLSHRIMTREKNLSVLRTQIGGGQRYIKRSTGVTPKWFRPPGGAIDSKSWKLVRAANLKVVLWDVDSEDWTRPGYKRIASNVINRVKPGSIVLMHDGGGKRDQTVAALPRIIRELRKKGYSFVTLDQLGTK